MGKRQVMRWLLQYLELVLTAVGLAICCLMIALLPPAADKWQVVAIVAIVISVIHGIAFFLVRARQRAVRNQAIHDVAHMLQEQVTDYVNIVSRLSSSDNSGHQQMARRAAGDLAELVDTLSEDALTSWRSRHGTLQSQALQSEELQQPKVDPP